MNRERERNERWTAEAVDLLRQQGRAARFRVRNGDRSMSPTLEPGTELLVDFSARPIRRGELLLFRQADYYVVHRLLGWARFPDGRPCLRTRGDGTPRLDPPVAEGSIVGRAVAVRTRDGWRSLVDGRARAYALGVALHDLTWAGAAVVVSRGGRALRPLAPWVSRLDRTLLRLAHVVLFRSFHPRTATPAAGAVGAGDSAVDGGRGPAVGPS